MPGMDEDQIDVIIYLSQYTTSYFSMHLLSSQSHSQANLKHFSYQKGSSGEFLTSRLLLRMTQMSVDNRTLLWPREPAHSFGWGVKKTLLLEEWTFELSWTEQALETDGWKIPGKTRLRRFISFFEIVMCLRFLCLWRTHTLGAK